MEAFIAALKTYLQTHPPDPDSVLAILYEAYNAEHTMDDETIKQDFHDLYEKMNGMTLQEIDRIIYPVCTLCRDHERSGFIHGVRVGIRLAEELKYHGPHQK